MRRRQRTKSWERALIDIHFDVDQLQCNDDVNDDDCSKVDNQANNDSLLKLEL